MHKTIETEMRKRNTDIGILIIQLNDRLKSLSVSTDWNENYTYKGENDVVSR